MKKITKSNKVIESIKKGLTDIKTVLEEGNYKLFLKQAIVIAALIFGFNQLQKYFDEKDHKIVGQMDAINTQQQNESDYLANKKKLLELEPLFPDIEAKNDWLLRQIISVFKTARLTPKIASAQSEDTSNANYVVTSIPVDIAVTYKEFGQFLASMENRDEFLRISEFMIVKQTEPIGQNIVRMKINTIFPKEKIARTIFKDTNTEAR